MNDKQFMTVLLGVTGVILIIFFMIFFIAQMIAPVSKKTDEFTNNAVVQRIEPVGKLNYAGSGSSDNESETQTASAERESICKTAEGDFKTYEVKMLNQGDQGSMIFEPAFIKINTCDSIQFEMVDAGHNAVTVAAPAGSMPFDTKYKPSTIVKFDVNGLYLYKCAPHAMMAMAGLIQVSDASNKADMEKAVMKFEGTVMMPNVKTRMSDLLRNNVK